MLDRRLKIGTFWGIGLYVHWTFALLMLFLAFQAGDGGWIAILFSQAILLGVFLCVTLHEYGHALTARKFGIPTVDITLLPIGGVARLERMPRIPWQELLVAVAGPAVNVVIASVLATGFVIAGGLALVSGTSAEALVEISNDALGAPSLFHFAFVLMIANVILVLFNMIPAFPMDGGRVFRSVLAMMIDYRRATVVASRVGVVCAVLMVLLTLNSRDPNWWLILIALFIAFAGMAEARQVDVMESVRGLKVRDVMIKSQTVVPMDTSLRDVAHRWQSTRESTLPVISMAGTVVGMIRLEDVATALAAGQDPTTSVGEILNHDTREGSVEPGDELETVVSRLGNQGRQLAVVDETGHLVGILDLQSMLLRGRLARHLTGLAGDDYPAGPVDATLAAAAGGLDRYGGGSAGVDPDRRDPDNRFDAFS